MHRNMHQLLAILSRQNRQKNIRREDSVRHNLEKSGQVTAFDQTERNIGVFDPNPKDGENSHPENSRDDQAMQGVVPRGSPPQNKPGLLALVPKLPKVLRSKLIIGIDVKDETCLQDFSRGLITR